MPKHKKHEKPVSVSTSTNSLFAPAQNKDKAHDCVQNVNIEINIDQKDDCMAGCFKGLASIFKKGV